MIFSIQPVPSRHGVHWPHDSWAKNRQMLCSTSTMLVCSSKTVTAAVPRPRQPTLPGPSKSSGVSNSASGHQAHADAAGDAAFGLASLPDAAAVLVDQLAHGDAQRQLDAARLVDVAADAVELRPIAAGVARVFRIGRHADRLEPVGAAVDDVRHARQRLDVVDDRRLAERPSTAGKRRLDARPGALAFQAFDQPRLLAADVGPGPAVHVDVEVEVLAENVLCRAGCWRTARRWPVAARDKLRPYS